MQEKQLLQSSLPEGSFKSTRQELNRQEQSQRKSQQFDSLLRLQQLIKNEYFLLATQSQQKKSFQSRLEKTLFSYYRCTVNMAETTYQAIQQQTSKLQKEHNISATNHEKTQRSATEGIYRTEKVNKPENVEKMEKYEEEKHLFSDEGFGDIYTFVKEILLWFSKNPYLMMTLIQKYQDTSNPQSLVSLIKVMVNSMYQNIVDDDVFNKDLIKIIIYCLKKLIQDKKHYFDINLNEEGFVQMILKELIERHDTKNYAKQIIKNTLLEIAKIDHFIDFKGNEQDEKTSFKSTSKLELKSKVSEENPMKQMKNNQNKPYDKRSKVKQYTQGLRYQDEKIKRGSIIRRKYKNCISDELLSKLGISEQVNFPCFSYKGNIQLKLQQEINRQLGIMLNKNQCNSQIQPNQDVIVIKNIILIFFNDLFKMLYSMPAIIRISSKILYKYLNLKFNNKNSLYVVADFIIGFWLVSALRLDVTMTQANKLSPYLQHNIEQVISIIKSIVKDNYKDVPQSFIKQFNLLVSNLKISLVNFICEVINIDSKKIDQLCQQVQDNLKNIKQSTGEQLKGESRNIKSFCVCINMSDIRKLLEMIKGAEREINQVNDKIVKRINRIQIMTAGKDVFGDKKEKSTGKWYKANRAYALFTELSLPSHLTIDYQKTYNNAVKNSKAKNLVRQVLLNLNDVSAYQQFYTSNNIGDFIQSIQFGSENGSLYSIDRIPLKLKLEYLQILSQKSDLFEVVLDLQENTIKRFTTFKETSERSKECYLKAISSIKFQNDKLNLKEQFIRGELKRRKLQEFFSKNEIKLCLTSPKTRQNEIVLKTNLMKDVLQQYKQKLWLQNQNKCIHAALNLQFIKSLTGQTEKTKVKYESHINSIMKFSQILCSLPEVKERFNTIDDSIGIKDVFFEFIQYIRDYIRSKQSQYAILLQNIQWLEQNIQLKISKKLYEKLYPKYALYDDIALYLRLKTLDWIDFEHLNIKKQLRKWNILQVAANHLRMIDKLRTAAQKLHCIEQTNKIIVNSYKLASKNDNPATADDINPLMILVLIKSAPKRLVSSIKQFFIESFASQSKLLSKEGYCFSQLKAAVQFCDNFSAGNLQIEQSEATKYIQFNKKIYEKQIQYGIYFMIPKSRDSPKAQKKKLQYLKEYFKSKQSSLN